MGPPSRHRIALAIVVLAGILRAQGGDSQPTTLPSADKRPVPATFGEGRRLVAQLEAERAGLAEAQRESPTPGRARTLQLLEEQIETIKRLEARREEMAAAVNRL